MTIENLLKIENCKLKIPQRGFVMLFAVMLSGIVLGIAIGVANIAYNEVRFGTSARDSNESFFAADTGLECALSNDKASSNSFVGSGGSGVVVCGSGTIPLSGAYPSWTFVFSGLGGAGQGCANVSVVKEPSIAQTTVVSKGYSSGGAVEGACTPGAGSTERQLQVVY